MIKRSLALTFATLALIALGPLVFGSPPLATEPASAACTQPPEGMEAWWRFEGNATELLSGNPGSLQGDATFAAGQVGQALSLDGSGDYVSVPDFGALDLPQQFTIDAWIFADSVSGTHVIVDKDHPTLPSSYQLAVQNGHLSADVPTASGDATHYETTDAVVSADAWHHVALSYDGTQGPGAKMLFYVDGNPVAASASGDVGGAPVATSESLLIGRSALFAGAADFEGLIDELELFHRVLTQSEIETIYDAGTDGECPEPLPPAATSITVGCSPALVLIGQKATCTAEVVDTGDDPQAPLGSVGFSSDGPGAFQPASCSLAAVNPGGPSSCNVEYTPSSNAGTHEISADYDPTTAHTSSSTVSPFALQTSLRPTSTFISCQSDNTPVGVPLACIVSVVDTGLQGTKSPPVGIVSGIAIISGLSGSLSFTECALVDNGPVSSACEEGGFPGYHLDVTPDQTGLFTMAATYSGSASHAASNFSGLVFGATARPTETTVQCTSDSLVVGEGTTCTATVADAGDGGTAITPVGTVTFGRAGDGTGSFSPPSCALVEQSAGVAACATAPTYTPSSGAGTHEISATYGGSSIHTESSDGTPFHVTVSLRQTATTTTGCSPDLALVNQTVQCSAVVTDIETGGSKSPPTGALEFSTDGGATVTGSCTLDTPDAAAGTNTCTATLTPADAGSLTITAAYNGSTVHGGSADATGDSLITDPRPTQTSVICEPDPLDVGETTTCSVTVADAGAEGDPLTPTGDVSFSTSSAGGEFEPDSAVCSLEDLDPPAAGVAACTVDYTAGGSPGVAHLITATYAGTDVHVESSNSFELTLASPTSISVDCAPAEVILTRATLCTALVTDIGDDPVAPLGTIDFSSDGTGAFEPVFCSLAPVASGGASTCSVLYTPGDGAGIHTIFAAYNPTTAHMANSGSFGLTVHAGLVEVVKKLLLGGDGRFDLLIEGEVALAAAGHDGRTGLIAVDETEVTVAEQAVPPADLVHYLTIISCSDQDNLKLAEVYATQATFTIQGGDSVLCIVTNVLIPEECSHLTLTNLILGTSGRDVLRGTAANDLILGFGGDDYLYGSGGGTDCVVGGDGDDRLRGDLDDVLIEGNGEGVISTPGGTVNETGDNGGGGDNQSGEDDQGDNDAQPPSNDDDDDDDRTRSRRSRR